MLLLSNRWPEGFTAVVVDGTDLGDIQAIISDRESVIIRGLEEAVLENSTDLTRLGRWIAELDVLLGLAIASRECNLVRPVVEERSNAIEITQGRHFLQELCVETFIPNDTMIRERQSMNTAGDSEKSASEPLISDPLSHSRPPLPCSVSSTSECCFFFFWSDRRHHSDHHRAEQFREIGVPETGWDHRVHGPLWNGEMGEGSAECYGVGSSRLIHPDLCPAGPCSEGSDWTEGSDFLSVEEHGVSVLIVVLWVVGL